MKKIPLYLLLISLLLISCTSVEYVPVETIKTEYTHNTDTIEKIDSVFETRWMTIKEVDSVELAKLGIQLKNITHAYVIEHNKVKALQQLEREVRIDTVYKVENIAVPYPVEKELTRWQQLKMSAGGISIFFCIGVILVLVSSLFLKFRK